MPIPIRFSTLATTLLLPALVLLASACGDDPASPPADDRFEADLVSPHHFSDPATAPFVVRVEADRDLAAVTFTVDGEVVAVDRQPPFAFLWNLALWADGEIHRLNARAVDPGGTEEHAGEIRHHIPVGTAGVLTRPPRGGGQADSTRALLGWRADPMATGYLVEVARDTGFTRDLRRATAPDTTTAVLVDGHAWYRWRVRSQWDKPETPPWSETGIFYAGRLFDRDYRFAVSTAIAGHAVAQAPDGGYLVAGRWDSGPGCFVLKTDPMGEPEWLDHPYLDAWFTDLVATPDGGCVVAGWIDGGDASRLLLRRLDAAGEEVWRREHYGHAQGSHGNALIACAAGGFLVAGASDDQAWLLRVDAQGRRLWETTVASGAFHAVVETATGDLLATGEHGSNASILARLSPAGEIIWAVPSLGRPGRDLLTDGEGCVVLTGDSWPGRLVRWDGGGQELAHLAFDGNPGELRALARAPGGGYRVFGEAVEIAVTGDLQIAGQRGLPGEFAAHAITADGGFVLTGSQERLGGGDDLWLLKANPAGDFAPPADATR